MSLVFCKENCFKYKQYLLALLVGAEAVNLLEKKD